MSASVMAIAGYFCIVVFVFYQYGQCIFLLFIPGFLIFAANGMLTVLTTVFLANTVDYGQWKNHRRDESVIFSMQTFVVKLASGIAALVASLCLNLCNLNSDTSDTVSAAARASGGSVAGLRMTMTLFPILLLVIGVIFFHKKYKLTDERLKGDSGGIDMIQIVKRYETMVLFTDDSQYLRNACHGDWASGTSVLRGADHRRYTGSFLLCTSCNTACLRTGNTCIYTKSSHRYQWRMSVWRSAPAERRHPRAFFWKFVLLTEVLLLTFTFVSFEVLTLKDRDERMQASGLPHSYSEGESSAANAFILFCRMLQIVWNCSCFIPCMKTVM